MKKLLFTLLGTLLCLPAHGWDFDFSLEYAGQKVTYTPKLVYIPWSNDCETKSGSYHGDLRAENEVDIEAYSSGNYIIGDLIIPEKADNYTVTEIATASFYKNGFLTSLELPNTVTKIGALSFYKYTMLASIVIPSSLTYIGDFAFYDCMNVGKIVSYATTPPDLGTSALSSIQPTIAVHIPKGCKEAYATAPGWGSFRNFREMDELGGIDDITADSSEDIDFEAPYDVYTLNGVQIAQSDITTLATGIYILRQGDKVKRIAVR